MNELNRKDHLINIAKAGISAIPLVGGSISSLIGDYIPLSTSKSVEKFIRLLTDKIEALESRVDIENINKDEFSELFKSCYLTVVRTHQEEKLRAAAEIFSNILLKDGDIDKLSYTELDHLIRCLENLSIGAIIVLVSSQKLIKDNKIRPNTNGDWIVAFESLRTACVHYEPSLLLGLLGELNTYNLLRIEGAPHIVTSEYGNYPLSLTPLGSKFVLKFINPS